MVIEIDRWQNHNETPAHTKHTQLHESCAYFLAYNAIMQERIGLFLQSQFHKG